VEDPAESFVRLRDRCDARFCLENQVFKGLTPQSSNLHAQLSAAHEKYKISKKQCRRLLELILLRQCKSPFAMHDYRLFVKAHMFRENKDALMAMEEGERKSQLQDLFADQLEEYQEILGLSEA
jgi:hypothetical protein